MTMFRVRSWILQGASIAGLVAASQAASAKAPVLSPVDFSSCANQNEPIGGPVGASVGNAQTRDSALNFTLLDPSQGNNAWVGSNGGSITIKLNVASPQAVYMLLNSGYGQSGVTNATVTMVGSSGIRQNFRLTGNKTIRDYNNWVWTNTINNTSTQEWWTNNLSPQPQDQSHREDAHKFDTSTLLQGETLTEIIVKAPANAGVNYMQPLLFAIGVDAGTGPGTIPSTCKIK